MYGRPASLQLVQRDGGPRHLHQAEDALLHPRAAGRGEQDVRASVGNRRANAGDECRADGDAHRAGHEREVLDPDDHPVAVDPARAR